MKYKIVWRKFKWQRFGRFWLYYFNPAVGEWRYANLSKFFKIRDDVIRSYGWNNGFRAKTKGE